MTQRTKFKLIAYLLLLAVLIGLVVWLWMYNNSVKRDYERISDMRVLQTRWLEYFNHYSTFEVNSCQIGRLVSVCGGDNGRSLSVDDLVDPKGSNQYHYLVEDVTESDFKVSFYLETNVGNLLPGKYVLTSQGIQSVLAVEVQ